jgi:hypothetical protein
MKSPPEKSCGRLRTAASAWRGARAESWWSQHREASLNWLALGLLLAAWNSSDNEASAQARARPESLRGYARVSVRAAVHHWERGAAPMS